MNVCWQQELRPGTALHAIVQEATDALIAMDTERLEELARCCADLNRELAANCSPAELREAADEIAAETRLLGRILVETRANLAVLTRLHVIHLKERLDSSRAGGDTATARNDYRHFCAGGGSYGDN